ncbi:MAG: hypothetical protein QOK14_890 [Frankiaceae bacterium]|jgi:uncharacterized iron-regulated membrane protein|nr:hypothetical protein [Frankiaceae bacterium]
MSTQPDVAPVADEPLPSRDTLDARARRRRERRLQSAAAAFAAGGIASLAMVLLPSSGGTSATVHGSKVDQVYAASTPGTPTALTVS